MPEPKETEEEMSSNVRAPQLDAGLAWLNTDRPLRLDGELAGRVVVLDFWTYCCINCMHILPDLTELEAKYDHEPVAFIGVHSSKFTNEASPATIRAAILRYEIKHPVLVDDNMSIWQAYAVRSWPTEVLVEAITSPASLIRSTTSNDDGGFKRGSLAPIPTRTSRLTGATNH